MLFYLTVLRCLRKKTVSPFHYTFVIPIIGSDTATIRPLPQTYFPVLSGPSVHGPARDGPGLFLPSGELPGGARGLSTEPPHRAGPEARPAERRRKRAPDSGRAYRMRPKVGRAGSSLGQVLALTRRWVSAAAGSVR